MDASEFLVSENPTFQASSGVTGVLSDVLRDRESPRWQR